MKSDQKSKYFEFQLFMYLVGYFEIQHLVYLWCKRKGRKSIIHIFHVPHLIHLTLFCAMNVKCQKFTFFCAPHLNRLTFFSREMNVKCQ